METALEQILTKSYKAGMIRFMAEHPEAFEEAIELAVIDKPPYSWRAAWLLWSCMEKNDQRVQPYVDTIIDILPNRTDNLQRELFKILFNMELNEACEGRLFNICLDVWERIHKQPSVRLNAFQLIIKMARKYPELSNEIALLTQEQYIETLSPGVKHSISRLLRTL
ncbi:MAG: hypothetical protein NTY32_02670 [Bacteroidia bacterium]|nr:hypothetical protein [Bacteroidia bacterium]